MHTGREREKLPDVIADQFLFLRRSLEIAEASGVRRDRIVLDPGFGFAKDADENLDLMARFRRAAWLRPAADGRHIAKALHRARHRARPGQRDMGTAATSVILRLKGAALFRVHNVAINVDALAFADAMLKREGQAGKSMDSST